MLIGLTFSHNKTFQRIGENDPRMFVVICEQHEMESWLRIARGVYEGANTLIILDDCAASKDVKGRTGELVNLAFSVLHIDISAWVQTQKYTSITAPFFSPGSRGAEQLARQSRPPVPTFPVSSWLCWYRQESPKRPSGCI